MQIDSTLIYAILVALGLCLGSFAGASVWRLRAGQLLEDEMEGEKVDRKEYNKLKKLTKKSISQDRSQCLSCNYELQWYDLIPLFSWLTLRGKCRKCRASIGLMEPLIELGVALFFVLSYAFWPHTLVGFWDISQFILWLAAGVTLAILFAYDAKWFILPNSINFTLIGIAAANSLIVFFTSQDKLASALNIVAAVLILSGLYFALYLVSKGKWIGFGDIKLGLGLALLLADWQLAFLALFAANLIGCVIVLPGLITGKLKRNSHIPFGPLLIAGTVLAFLVGNYLIHLYFFNL